MSIFWYVTVSFISVSSINNEPTYQLHLNTEGQFVIGGLWPYSNMDDESFDDIFLGANPSALIYQEHRYESIPYQHLLACRSKSAQDNTWKFPGPEIDVVPDKGPLYFGSAPLARTSSTKTFLDPITASCRGIIIRYEDGTERALGQCRVGVDPSEICIKPQQIRYQIVSWASVDAKLGVNAKVEFRGETTHEKLPEGWVSANMSGELKCWFNEEVLVVRVD